MIWDKGDKEEQGLSIVLEHLKQINNKLDLLLEKKPSSMINKEEDEPLLDNQDVCFMLGISKRTLQRYRQKNIIPYYVLEKKPYYKKSEVLSFLKTYIRNSRHRKE